MASRKVTYDFFVHNFPITLEIPQEFSLREFFGKPYVTYSQDFYELVLGPALRSRHMPRRHDLIAHEIGKKSRSLGDVSARFPSRNETPLVVASYMVELQREGVDGNLNDMGMNGFWGPRPFTVSYDGTNRAWHFHLWSHATLFEKGDLVFAEV